MTQCMFAHATAHRCQAEGVMSLAIPNTVDGTQNAYYSLCKEHSDHMVKKILRLKTPDFIEDPEGEDW